MKKSEKALLRDTFLCAALPFALWGTDWLIFFPIWIMHVLLPVRLWQDLRHDCTDKLDGYRRMCLWIMLPTAAGLLF